MALPRLRTQCQTLCTTMGNGFAAFTGFCSLGYLSFGPNPGIGIGVGAAGCYCAGGMAPPADAVAKATPLPDGALDAAPFDAMVACLDKAPALLSNDSL